ncbi:MAG: polysialyltransferase family glycosyltransferase [Rhodanobacter sp.]
MKNKTAIVIGFTPFHLIPMMELTHSILGEIFLFHPMLDTSLLSGFGGNPRFLGACNRPSPRRLWKYARAGREIKNLMRNAGDADDVDVYVPHPFNPLSNYAFFLSEHSSKYIYQDGILNYYDAASPLGSRSCLLRQKAKAAIIGLPYRAYAGHLSGIDNSEIAGGFFTHPERIVHASRFHSIRKLHLRPGPSDSSTGSRSGTLFLDQPMEGSVGKLAAGDLQLRTIDFVNSLEGPVFYKPHYAQKAKSPPDPAWRALDSHSQSLPAELLVARLGIKSVVSFYSSALANIALNHSDMNCYATAAEAIPVSIDGRSTTLAEVLSGLGVKIADIRC